jgi:hypothetical protein
MPKDCARRLLQSTLVFAVPWLELSEVRLRKCNAAPYKAAMVIGALRSAKTHSSSHNIAVLHIEVLSLGKNRRARGTVVL